MAGKNFQAGLKRMSKKQEKAKTDVENKDNDIFNDLLPFEINVADDPNFCYDHDIDPFDNFEFSINDEEQENNDK